MRKPVTKHRAQGRNSCPGIQMLVTPPKAREREIKQASGILINKPAVFFIGLKVLPADCDWARTQPTSLRFKHRTPFNTLISQNNRAAAFDDACFFSRNFFNCITKIFHMIKGNGRDHAGDWRGNDIGCVKLSPQTHLQQQHIGWCLCKEYEGCNGCHLENSDRLAGICGLAALEYRSQLIFIHKLSSQPDALVKPHKMGRCVNVHSFSCGLKHGAHERYGRTLAVGASHVDGRWELELGVPQLWEKKLHAIQRQVDFLGMERQKPRHNCCAVGHGQHTPHLR